MTNTAILIIACMLLLSFVVDKLSSRIGLPAVIVMITLGMISKPVLNEFNFQLRILDSMIPVIGTIGLVLIVLEGALDLKINRENSRENVIACASGVLGVMICATVFTFVCQILFGFGIYKSLLVAIPLSVIGSAIAIPGSDFSGKDGKEFIVYESTVSDIFGILIFFAVLHSNGTTSDVLLTLGINGGISIILGGACAIGLVFLLSNLTGHVRHIPLLAALFALYVAGKLLHLSPLIMVLMFGLILNNIKILPDWKIFGHMIDNAKFSGSIGEFKSLIAELTFAVRGVFFILLGYWTDLNSIINIYAFMLAVVVLVAIYISRYGLLKILGVSQVASLLWIAPRGLITVLLYLTVRNEIDPPDYLDGALLLVVILSAALMVLGRRRVS